MTHFDSVLPYLVGRTISHVVVKSGEGPRIQGGSRLYEGTLDDVRSYMSNQQIEFET